MKRRITRLLALVLALLCLTGCGSQSEPQAAESSGAQTRSAAKLTDDADEIKADTPVVTVSGGQLKGYVTDDGSVRVYKGVPYAKAERWKAPEATSWDGVLDCKDYGPSCIQEKERPMGCYTAEFMGSAKEHSENCQVLNIWTGNDDTSGKPVIVYIHGGGYSAGSGSCFAYDGKGLAQKGVVFVNINYRLGLFGFFVSDELIAEDRHAAGNYGILDQIAALQWVQENIEQFGGDRNNVTIMGQSAGSGSVNMLTISPYAAGLFQRVISLSHNSVSNANYGMPTLEEAVRLYDEAYEKKNLPKRSLAEMRAMSDTEFYDAYLPIWNVDTAPCEPMLDGDLLPGTYAEVVASGRANDVDVMYGACLDDPDPETEGVAEKADRQSGETAMFHYAWALGGYEGRTWAYLYTHAMPGKRDYGAFHTSDVPYFLNTFTLRRAEYWTEDDFVLGDRMSDYIVNFARTGNPNGEGLPEWPQNSSTADEIDFGYLRLDLDTRWQTVSTEAQEAVKAAHAELLDFMRLAKEG